MLFAPKPQSSDDGDIEVCFYRKRYIRIRVEQNGIEQTLVVSPFNTMRLFAAIALIIEVPVPKKVLAVLKVFSRKSEKVASPETTPGA
jgi:hypothetical protein